MKSFSTLLSFLMLLILASNITQAEVQKYYLEFSQSDIDLIYANAEEDIYIYGTIKTAGDPIPCRMRIRGDGTRKWPKKSLKIVFDNETLDGRDKINFNAEYEDYSYLNSVLSSQIYRSTGHPCFEASHAAIYLNGNFWGLYVRIENIDDSFLEANGLNPEDDLYKATFDGASLSTDDDVNSLWEKKTNENTGRQNLQDLIDTLNTTDPLKFKDFAEHYFDYDKMINFISVNLLLSNFSTYYHNYYMYQKITTDSKWMPIPWDMDKTFYKYGLYTDILNSSSFYNPDNPMLEWSFFDPRVKNDIINRVTYLINNNFTYDGIIAKIDSLKAEIRQYVELDNTDKVNSIEDWENYIEQTKSYVKDRPQHLLNQLNYYPSNFRVEKIDNIVTSPPTIKWEKSVSPEDRKMTYQIRYNKNFDLYTDYLLIDSIDALSYTFPADLPEGKYYYLVRAFDRYIYIDGTDNHNYFIYKKPDTEYCTINSEVRFTKDKSPYVIDCDMEISAGGKLIIEPGVEVYFTDSHSLNVYGELLVNGNSSERVTLTTNAKEGIRNKIKTFDGSRLEINHCNLVDIALLVNKSDVVMKNFDLNFTFEAVDNQFAFIDCYWSNIDIQNGSFYRNSIGVDGIIFWNSVVNIENCTFENIRDATELVACVDSKVIGNTYYNSLDDAIDFNGGTNIEVSYNLILGAFDKGISIGNQEDTLATGMKIHHNIIVGCGMGTSFKDNSEVEYYNNTLYNNQIPLEALRMGVNKVSVKNTIFMENQAMPQESLNKLDFTYNLSNKDKLPGIGNIQADPNLFNPDANDFSLLSTSPAIDAGDPNSPNDADGTRADIGALPFSQIQANVVINEIHYNQDDIKVSGDWVELYNNSTEKIDISGWYFSDSDDAHKFYIPDNTILLSHHFIVLVELSSAFAESYPGVNNYIGEMGFGLSGKGELLRLYDSKDKLVDYVEYDDKEPWPTEPDGEGYSLSLIDPDYDNALPESWYASEEIYGTPGKPNNENKVNEEFAQEGLELYPLPAENYIILKSKDLISTEKLSITDAFGRQIVLNMQQTAKNSVAIDLSDVTSGVYFITITKDGRQITGSFIKVK